MVFISVCFIKIKVKLRKMGKKYALPFKNDLFGHFIYFSKIRLIILPTYRNLISLQDTSYCRHLYSLA